MPTTIEDRLVVGDATVVADLYRQHGALIHTISQQLVDAAADRLTQQIFVEAWRDRLDFNPSMGSVRNWLIRRARERVSSPPDGSDAAVDRIVVADSMARMVDVRRRVLSAGVGASNIEDLARELDLPVASVKGHLRRGMESLKADLADSRTDGSGSNLAEILAGDGPLVVELVAPPSVVWNAVDAELRLGVDGPVDVDLESAPPVSSVTPDSTSDDADEMDELDAEDVLAPDADEAEAQDAVVEVDGQTGQDDGSDSSDSVDDNRIDDAGHEAVDSDHLDADADADADTDADADGMEALRADAVRADLDRPIWQNPAAVILALIIVALLIAIIF